MATRLRFTAAMVRVMPPWLRRTHGARFLQAIGDVVEDILEASIAGAKLRFPGHDASSIDPGALAAIGRERRIRRGPGEDAATYAARLLPWWDDHRNRGGPYALLRQIHAYLRSWLNVRVDVVYHSGTRRWIDEDGAITRDAIVWSVPPDGDDERWAQVWVIYHLPDEIPIDGALLATSSGSIITTSGGIPIATTSSISPGALTATEEEIFLTIPREWSAAHIARTFVVLLYGSGELWDYPTPVGTWDEWESPTLTFDSDLPAVLVLE